MFWKERCRAFHVGSISFEQQSIKGDVAKHFARCCFAWLKEVGGEGEIRTQSGKGCDHFSWSAVAVQEERGQCFDVGQHFIDGTPSFKAVDGHRAIELATKSCMGGENFPLMGFGNVLAPVVDATFSDAGVGFSTEEIF